MSIVGSSLSTLSLNMLDKKSVSLQDEVNPYVNDLEMVLLDVTNQISKDDLNDIDIMTYSGALS